MKKEKMGMGYKHFPLFQCSVSPLLFHRYVRKHSNTYATFEISEHHYSTLLFFITF